MARRRKSGQVDVPFHFIFALVGGFLFLLFFFILIRQILGGHDETIVREQSFAVETILATALSESSTFRSSRLSDADYAFVCEASGDAILESYVRMDKGSYDPQGLLFLPVFSPAEVKGDTLLSASYTWKAPFPCCTLLVLSNNRTRLVFVASPSHLPRLRQFIEEENLGKFGHDIVAAGAIGSYQDEGFDQYRFVYVNSGFVAPRHEFQRAGNSALVVSLQPDGKRGTLEFIDDLARPGTRTGGLFYGRAMLNAAIFSQDHAAFSCNFLKLSGRLKTAVTILALRLADLRRAPLAADIDPDCQPLYATAEGLLQQYALLGTIGQLGAAAGAGGLFDQIDTLNFQLAGAGCPMIY